jgi:xanthine permease
MGFQQFTAALSLQAFLSFFISFFFGKLVSFFPPVVTGSVVTIIGITLMPVAMNNMAGGEGSADFGDLSNLALSFYRVEYHCASIPFYKRLYQVRLDFDRY